MNEYVWMEMEIVDYQNTLFKLHWECKRKECFDVIKAYNCKNSFIHSGHFYSAPSSPLLLRGAPEYSTDTVSDFHAEAHMQLQVKDLPKDPMCRLERESNPWPYGWKSSSQPRRHHVPRFHWTQKSIHKILTQKISCWLCPCTKNLS